MATNETTNFAENYSNDSSVQTNNKNERVAENGWHAVTISGVAGILMGAGAMYATEAFANTETLGEESPKVETEETTVETSGEEASVVASGTEGTAPTSHIAPNTDELHVATVDQSLSFGQAFAAARAEVGPGGVFHWHGGVFNTYYLDEWNQMSPAERASFAKVVQPEIQTTPAHITIEGSGSNTHIHIHIHNHEDNPQPSPVPEPKPEPTPEPESEVRFLGFDNVNIEGEEYEAGHMLDHGHHVYLLDLDNDPEHVLETAITDFNQDGKLTADEAWDISDRHITIEQFGLMTIIDNLGAGTEGSTQVALNSQDAIGSELPDYMNDANPLV